MTPELTDLARRAVACKGWRWMPGMLIHTGFRCVWVDDETFRSFDQNGNEMYGSTDCLLPDLTDHATLGCVLALVREAWVDLHMVACCDDRHGKVSWWICRWGDLPRSRECSTEADALVAALEVAP